MTQTTHGKFASLVLVGALAAAGCGSGGGGGGGARGGSTTAGGVMSPSTPAGPSTPSDPSPGAGGSTGAGASSGTGTTPAAWTRPIGIPEPSFGIREAAPAAPSPWASETPGFYYVDFSTGSDARALGTPAAPRKTIPATLPAGAVVEVHGNYDAAPMGYSVIDGAGTASQPIFIRGASAAARPTFRRELHVKGSYMILENLRFADFDGTIAGSPVLLAPAHHVALRHCDISGNATDGGLGVESWSAEYAHDIVVYDNTIHDNGDYLATFDQDCHGIHVGKNVDHVWIVDNEMTRNSGDGLQINAGTLADQRSTHHIYVGRNVSHRNKQSGMWTKQAVDVVFSQNRIYDHRPSDSSPGGGIGFQYGPQRVWILFNDISDCEMGIYTGSDSGMGDGTDQWIIGNVVHGVHARAAYDAGTSWSPAAITLAGGKNVRIVDNTLYDVDAGVNAPVSGASLTIASNVIAGVTRGNHLFLDQGSTAAASTLRGNVLGGAVEIRWAGAAQDLGAFLAGHPGMGSVAADPQLTDPASGDFTPRAGSAAVDAGVASDAYATFQSLYGLSIEVDAEGRRRPVGAGWDAGALERQ